MKTLFILCLFLISTFTVFSQNGDASALSINWNDTTTFIPKQTEFYLGWHWTGPRKEVNDLLHINHFQCHWGYTGTRDGHLPDIPNDGKKKAMVWQLPNNYSIYNFFPALQFDPTAPVRPVLARNNQGGIHPRVGDTTGAVYGFGYRNMTSGSLPTYGSTNFDRYVLTKSGVSSTGVVVLDSATIQSSLFYMPWDSNLYLVRRSAVLNDSITGGQRNGAEWYLSVNLRRTSALDLNMDDSVVLIIKIPYFIRDTSNHTQNFILFDSIAVTSNTTGNTDTLPQGRGRGLKLRFTPSTSDSTEFVITRRMLPLSSAAQPDITISAFFHLKSNQYSGTHNPELQNLWEDYGAMDISRIIQAGIRVRYYGRCDIGGYSDKRLPPIPIKGYHPFR